MRGSRSAPATVRVRLDITGVVQGVGFRPAVARVAADFCLSGFVFNDAGSVQCELEGPADRVEAAVRGIRDQPPPMARIDGFRTVPLIPHGASTFEHSFQILDSQTGDAAHTLVPPDVATCADCLRELRDPADRRFGHPFITCTNCGPRYTVITDLPYDRPATTMDPFAMCTRCADEYRDSADRRFHAQTIACRDCGPTLSWSGPATDTDPITAAAHALNSGLIIAIKGIGGYHLACRADDPDAVALLRKRKNRPAKPFAVMAADLAAARRFVAVDAATAAVLESPPAPIVLTPKRGGSTVVDAVAPGLAELGVMLAYSPVHHLLFDHLGAVPLVMTSANQGGSPIVFRDGDLDWIDGLCDGILTHDRPIQVSCEDSVVAVEADGAVVPIRRSRGFAPLPVTVQSRADSVIVATGGDLKTTFCLMGADGYAHMSSHLGDMADPRTQSCFDAALDHLAFMTDRRPKTVACDLHPSYATTRWAQRRSRAVVGVQHHHAHAVSLLAEHQRLGTPIIAVAFDGTGYGADGTIWGGELLAITDPAVFTRVGHLAPFALPGGDGAVRHPARIALDLMHRAGVGWSGDLAPVEAVGEQGLAILAQQIPRGIGCVATTSMGRLFDGVASLLGVCHEVSYEGQAAIELEHLARSGDAAHWPVEFAFREAVFDPRPVVVGLVAGIRAGIGRADLAAAFHAAVVHATVWTASECARSAGISTIGLTGGVFVNRILLNGIRAALTGGGFEVLTHRIVPCNDGGLALGQAAIAAAAQQLAEKEVAYVSRNSRQGDRDLGGVGYPDVDRRLRRDHEEGVSGVPA
ncbi:carbamoyltransferase HypF [Mycolicibacterium komossense]|uniref:Carbamoyltransferase n=1 Tax=Mycolicibacterium komossense TaxID=1779 RepID=A0ABT3CN37_9MYCO|nr:carbamoyltransferase HypF [Mycolicibacterium komossense]MCV7230855.1 carbamoyltransferase HypF [Mycolicibacterium komossense]